MSKSSMYSKEDISNFNNKLIFLKSDKAKLANRIISFQLNEAATNYAFHGFLRRMTTLAHCIEKIFNICPPNTLSMKKDDISDTTIFLQAFVFNAFGAVDNLCHVLNAQLLLVIPNGKVGFGKKYQNFREKMSDDFNQKTEKFENWFSYLSDYRHALAHRIPLYIPPLYIVNEDADEYRSLDSLWHEAVISDKHELADELNEKMNKLGSFQPFMVHSFREKHPHISFHMQIIEDWTLICDLCNLVFDEIQNRK